MEKWEAVRTMLLEKYGREPEDYKLSIGHWETEPTIIPGVELPEFHAYLCITVGELRINGRLPRHA